MKRLSILLLLIIAVCLIGVATNHFFLSPDNTIKKTSIQNIGKEHFAGSFKVQVAINPRQPRVGKNQVKLIIRDKNDQPVNNASIKAVAEMPAMGSMPTMYAPAEITSEQPGLYQGQFELPMMGAWPLTLTIDAGSQGQAQLSFDMGTSRKGLSLSSATPSIFAPQPDAQSDKKQLQSKTFKVDTYRRQLIGVTTEKVTSINMTEIIHSSAIISYDQTSLTDINLKFNGWIDKLDADYVGKQVKKGQTLFTVYSPDLVSSQNEYLHSFKRKSSSHTLKAAAARRLSLWGINQSQIRALEKRGQPLEYLPILSPISGTIIEKNIVPGAAFTASSKLLRIADLSTVWVEGQ
ncbi:MAG: efflux RND transporter periplasmic adaptor subunit, partial [Gammaproteobacteria bacterium]|nr:efflux RND transporter periplasmic adaptor subunit [Gammaproteobacteria bacterium]